VAAAVGIQVLKDKPPFWLLPLRDLIAPIVWAAGFFGNTIHWRGNVFRLKHGQLEKLG
jgi:hypothetical protein